MNMTKKQPNLPICSRHPGRYTSQKLSLTGLSTFCCSSFFSKRISILLFSISFMSSLKNYEKQDPHCSNPISHSLLKIQLLFHFFYNFVHHLFKLTFCFRLICCSIIHTIIEKHICIKFNCILFWIFISIFLNRFFTYSAGPDTRYC